MRKLIVASMFLLLVSTQANAAVDEKYKKGWDEAFQYVDQAIYAVVLDFGLSFVPFVEQAEKLALRYTSSMATKFAALGLDAKKYPLTSVDAVQLTRIALAIDFGETRKASPIIRAEILAYALCPWTSAQCMDDVKAAIFARRGWKV